MNEEKKGEMMGEEKKKNGNGDIKLFLWIIYENPADIIAGILEDE